jgi:hypothetical protein
MIWDLLKVCDSTTVFIRRMSYLAVHVSVSQRVVQTQYTKTE